MRTAETGHIDWYHVRYPSRLPAELYAAWSGQMKTGDLCRRDRFLRQDLKERFVFTRATVASILSHHLRCNWADLELTKDDHGRPHLRGTDAPDFNISHCQDSLMVAISQDRRIGVDIEQPRTSFDYLRLAKRFFQSTEVAYIAESSPQEVPSRFLELWTLKEASLKCLGVGLRGGMQRFQFKPIDAAGLSRVAMGSCDMQHVSLKLGSHWLAFAWKGGDASLRRVSFDAINDWLVPLGTEQKFGSELEAKN